MASPAAKAKMPISPTMLRNNSFTLIEIVIVVAVILLATGIAVATYRGDSPARVLDSTSLDFEAFCAGVRYQAMEHGEERIVSLDPQNHRLVMLKPTEKGSEEETSPEIRAKMSLPEEMTLDIENDSDEEYTELFRFFPDGGASGKRELIFRYNSLQRKYVISPLTGKLYVEETEE